MIIKTGGISSGDGARITAYVVTQAQNERVDVIQDENDQLLVTDDFAIAKGRRNGLLHIIISPDQELTPAQLAATVTAIRTEFGFNPGDPETLTRHQSRRADGSLQDHFHLVRPAQDTDTGRTYKLFRSKAKDEAVSRLCELQFGHQLTSGANNQFAEMRLREQGRDDLADQLAEAFPDVDKPKAAYRHDDHQQAKRNSFDLPALRQRLKEVAELPSNRQPQALAELINQQGLKLAPAVTGGRGRSRIMIQTPEGVKDHNANRTLKIKAAQAAAFIEETQGQLQRKRTDRTAKETVSEHPQITKDNQEDQDNDRHDYRPDLRNDRQTNSDLGEQSSDANSDQQLAKTDRQTDDHEQPASQISASDNSRPEAETNELNEAASSPKVQSALNKMRSTPAGVGAISSGVEPMAPVDLSKPGAAMRALQMWARLMKRLLQKRDEQERAAKSGYSTPGPTPKSLWT